MASKKSVVRDRRKAPTHYPITVENLRRATLVFLRLSAAAVDEADDVDGRSRKAVRKHTPRTNRDDPARPLEAIMNAILAQDDQQKALVEDMRLASFLAGVDEHVGEVSRDGAAHERRLQDLCMADAARLEIDLTSAEVVKVVRAALQKPKGKTSLLAHVAAAMPKRLGSGAAPRKLEGMAGALRGAVDKQGRVKLPADAESILDADRCDMRLPFEFAVDALTASLPRRVANAIRCAFDAELRALVAEGRVAAADARVQAKTSGNRG